MRSDSVRPDRLSESSSNGRAEVDYQAVLDALPRPTLILEPPDYVMIAANPARHQATNTRPEDVLGRKLFDVFPDNPDDAESTGEANLRASLRRVLETRRPDVMAVQKYDIPAPGGGFEERWWSPINTPVLGPDGSVRYIIHQVDDVTAEVRERHRAARAEAEHVRCLQLADAIPGLVFETDTCARNIYVNEQFLDYTGLPLRDLLEDGWRHAIHPDERDAVVEAWCEALASGETFERECRIRAADGRWRWFVVRGTLLRDARGRVERAVGICTDITERQEREAFQALLIREIGHRVKNSLALVSALLNLQARSLEGGPRAALQDAASRVHAVATVHDQLWRQSEAREVDLQPFLQNLAAALAEGAPRHSTRVAVEPVVVSADVAVPVGLLVNELVTNAYKYAYPAGEEGEVRIAGRREGAGRYRVEVADAGRGLPPGFDMSRSSASLGMRVISTLVKQLDAELTIGSPDRGASFSFSFPLA